MILPNFVQFASCSSAILIIKIGFLKASLRLAFKKPILVFPAPLALETPKSVS
jgi:hypothetical protein